MDSPAISVPSSTARATSSAPRRAAWTRATLVALFTIALSTQAIAQGARPTDPRLPAPTTRFGLAGPRFGITILDGGSRDRLAGNGISVAPIISQFGWQFERVFLGAAQTGPVAVTELVLLAGGLDQGTLIPSGSWIIGVRGTRGGEFGVGPNVTPAGVALAVAAGITKHAGTLNVPLTLAVVPAKGGVRISMLGGFTIR